MHPNWRKLIWRAALHDWRFPRGESEETGKYRSGKVAHPSAHAFGIEDLVRYADVSLQSEMETVRAINKECEKQGKRHKIILMMDLGDIREGYVDEEELIAAAVETEKLSHVDLYGIGTNLTCFSFIQADEEKMERLAEMRKKVENAAGHTLEIVSGGNSAALDLMMRGGICEG